MRHPRHHAAGPVPAVFRPPLAAALLLLAAAAAAPPARPAPAPARAAAKTVVLLDLNYTLVENQSEAARLGGEDFGDRIRHERYRRWLRDLVRDRHVILITARPARHARASLDNIRRLLGWEPDEAWFNEKDLPPPACKRDILLRHVFPRHGRPGEADYVAIESNPRTAVMYASYGIPALRVWDEWQYGDSTKVVK